MRDHIKRILAVLMCAAALFSLAACSRRVTDPKGTAKPSLQPRAAESAMPSPSADATESMTPSQSPSSTGAEGEISGFMEGTVVDPDDAPELTAALAKLEEYKDMAIQSVTYKLYEGRQAYYVILQGEGEASHPVYVFADGSVVPEE